MLQRELVGRGGGIVLLENFAQDAAASEQSEGAGEFGVLAGKSRLEALLGDVLIIRVRGILGVDVVFLEELRKAENGTRETVSVSMSSDLKHVVSAHQSNVYRVQKTFFRVSMVRAPKENRF